jgi:ribonucleotide reductase beta subunit family protein with ferritin-like domain
MQAAGDVHEMYEKSLAVEPREREDEKIVRYVRPYVRLEQVSTYGGFSLVMWTRGGRKMTILASHKKTKSQWQRNVLTQFGGI